MPQQATATATVAHPKSSRKRLSSFDQLSHDADRLMRQLSLPQSARTTARAFYVTARLIVREQENTDGSCLRKDVEELRAGSKLIIKITKVGKSSFRLLVRQQTKGSQWVDVSGMLDGGLRMALAINLDEKRNRREKEDDFLLIDKSHLDKSGPGWQVLCSWITHVTN